VRPVEFGRARKVRPRVSPQRRHRPDADVAAGRGVLLANPTRNERAIGREPQGTDRSIDEFTSQFLICFDDFGNCSHA